MTASSQHVPKPRRGTASESRSGQNSHNLRGFTCPPWCTTNDHGFDPPVVDILMHSREMGRVREDVWVDIESAGKLPGAVAIYGAEDLTPDQARAVAALLVQAADLLEVDARG